MTKHTANNGDTVIAVAISWQGQEVFSGIHQVDKTYKNGNVVLKGHKGQFYHMPTDDGYKLSQCSGSMQLVKITDDVKLRIEKSKAIEGLFTAQYALEKTFSKNRRFISRLSLDEIQVIKNSLLTATNLIDGDNENEINR